MTDEFLTEGLQHDRYLKALRLIEQFKDEIEGVLRGFDQRMVDAQPSLFEPSTDPDFETIRDKPLASHRVDHKMTGPRAPEIAPESDGPLQLNVHLYWVPPTEYDRAGVEGALRAFGYKIKFADTTIDERVAEQTRSGDWSLKTARNPFDDNIAFYRHVRSSSDVESTIEESVKHFSTFGDEYAVGSAE